MAFPLRSSRSAFDAAVATAAEVVFRGAFVCESALAAAFFEVFPVEGFRRTDDALLAAFRPVVLDFAMFVGAG
ncbi:MAG TPA: hypothetical protein VK610_10955 [Rhodothermales bacterium]|nr:hypothetical protein [Rhodothermales bacterium]